MLTALSELNAMDLPGFVAALDGVYERSPWVAEAAIDAGPFASRLDLLDALNAAMLAAPRDTQRALIDACPDLLDDDAAISAEFRAERHRAGLDEVDPGQRAKLLVLSARYRERYGYGFIIALRGHEPATIAGAIAARLDQDDDQEFARALHEVGRIAADRLAARIVEPAGDEIVAMCARLAWLTERKHALTCTALTPAHRATAALLRDWMFEAGLDASVDALGNVVGRLRSAVPGARTLLIGSHYDTAADGGPFDGRIGIVLAIVVARQLRLTGWTLPFNLEVVAFGDRHGQRFGAPFTGSGALAGRFDPMSLIRRDADGITLAEALQQAGHDPLLIPALARDPARIAACLEIQTEQGPVLAEAGQPVGIATAILGLEQHRVAITGRGGHAGSVPMPVRRDAAAAAAECVLAVEALERRHPQVRATVGQLAVHDGAINAVAARCELSVDLRAADDEARRAAAADLWTTIASIAERRGIDWTRTEVETMPASACDARLAEQLVAAVTTVMPQPAPLRLPSGPRHDTAMLAALAPTALLLVRHDAARTVSAGDSGIAAAVVLEFLRRWKPA